MVVFCCLSLACKDAETENWFCLFVNKEHFFPCTGTSSHRWVCWQCDRDTTDVCEPQVHRHWTTRSHGGHEEGGSSGHFLQRYETFFSPTVKKSSSARFFPLNVSQTLVCLQCVRLTAFSWMAFCPNACTSPPTEWKVKLWNATMDCIWYVVTLHLSSSSWVCFKIS